MCSTRQRPSDFSPAFQSWGTAQHKIASRERRMNSFVATRRGFQMAPVPALNAGLNSRDAARHKSRER